MQEKVRRRNRQGDHAGAGQAIRKKSIKQARVYERIMVVNSL
jgi:hypothetical protein